MPALKITLPQLYDDFENALFLQWLRKTGDRVQKGDPVAEIETDKSTMEVQAACDGTLLRLADLAEREVIKTGQFLYEIDAEKTAEAFPENKKEILPKTSPIQENRTDLFRKEIALLLNLPVTSSDETLLDGIRNLKRLR